MRLRLFVLLALWSAWGHGLLRGELIYGVLNNRQNVSTFDTGNPGTIIDDHPLIG